MDAFVKKLFPNFDAPGLPFVELEPGMVNHTYMQGIFETKPPYVSQNKTFYSVQPMTMLGRTTAEINSGSSSVDGLGKHYIAPQGLLNLDTIIQTVRTSVGGMEAQVKRIRSWSWNDNHTTLLVNALRYALITKTMEISGDIDNKLPEFSDGRIRIDPNFGMRMTSDSHWDKNDWPAGTDSANYPEMTRLTEWIPPQPDNPALDLRGMNGVEARFITLMLGAWKSRSNLRLDFEFPKLADNIYYRVNADLPGLTGWLYQWETDQKPVIPSPPTSDIAWSAITKYVERNRLYDHFSAALHIVTSLMYQMVPVTADGQIWLSYDWRVSLPAFDSIRGRFSFLNEGDAAYGNQRALNEWSYIGNNLEVIHLMAMVFVQAIQTGLAIRSVRMATEDNPKDLFASYLNFYSFNMMSAAAAEAVRGPAPLPGMSGVLVEIQHDFDVYNTEGRIPTLNDKGDDIETFVTVVENDKLYVAAPWTTFAGVPTLLLPLNPFPYNSPFTLKGELNKEMGRHQFRGFRVGAPNAWILTTIVGLAGYQIKALGCSHASQAKEYHYIDMAKMTWPVLRGPDDVGNQVVLAEQDKLGDYKMKCITLPHIDSNFFHQQVPYETTILNRGISTSATRGRKLDVREFCGRRLSFEGVRLHFKVGEGVRASRAFITREEMHFRVVENDAH